MDPMDLRQSQSSDPGIADPAAGIRAVTWLAPGIPLAFFETLCAWLSRALSVPIQLESRDRSSGPMHGDSDPFETGHADIGFLCSPSYLYLASKPRPSVRLVPAGFAFDLGLPNPEPIYYSEVIVRAGHPAQRFEDLAGGIWGFNDECSLSGYFSALQELNDKGDDGSFFGSHVRTGSHFASIQAALAGNIDAAAIDSNVLSLYLRDRPRLATGLRTLTSFGPYPIQPIVLRSGLCSDLSQRIAQALLHLHEDREISQALADFQLLRFVPIAEQAYAEERRALCSLSKRALPLQGAPCPIPPSSIPTPGTCSVTSAASAERP